MASEMKKELKRALLGRTVVTEDGKLAVMAEGDYRIPLGVSDGALSVSIFGIGFKSMYIASSLTPASTMKAAREAMRHVGRELLLYEMPEAAACIRRYRLTRPVVLTFSYSEDTPILTAWAGRAPLSFISRRIAIKTFLKHLPKSITPAVTEKADKRKAKAKKNKTKKGGNK